MKYWKFDFDIISDCCYSGNWAIELAKYQKQLQGIDAYVLAASWPESVAYDSPNGGLYTLFKTKKLGDAQRDKLYHCWAANIDGKYQISRYSPQGIVGPRDENVDTNGDDDDDEDEQSNEVDIPMLIG